MWVLFIYMLGYSTNTVTTQEFNSKEKCEMAKKVILDKTWRLNGSYVECFKK